jgi:O-antigen/teichoic acid export membrane protein
MFPKISGLEAKKMDTRATLKVSLFYVLVLSILAVVLYNLFPGLILKILTGKAYPESVFLGRFFSISMSFFTLSFILIAYFLSIRDLQFIKYLVALTILQLLAIAMFHKSLVGVQLILSINAVLTFIIFLLLVWRHGKS